MNSPYRLPYVSFIKYWFWEFGATSREHSRLDNFHYFPCRLFYQGTQFRSWRQWSVVSPRSQSSLDETGWLKRFGKEINPYILIHSFDVYNRFITVREDALGLMVSVLNGRAINERSGFRPWPGQDTVLLHCLSPSSRNINGYRQTVSAIWQTVFLGLGVGDGEDLRWTGILDGRNSTLKRLFVAV